MTQSALLLNSFLLRVVSTALLTVLASLHPIALQLIGTLGAISFTAYICCWLLDDWLMERLKVSQGDYFARLLITGIAALLGIGAGLWIIL